MTNQTANRRQPAPANKAIEAARNEQLTATESAMACMKEYARTRPEVVTLWAFGIGFVLGWKLKPW